MREFVTLFLAICKGWCSMMTRECVANRILQLCQERNMTINALARTAGIAPSTVKNILNGASKNPGVVTIKMICDGLGITLIDFFDTDEFRELEQEIQ